MIDTSVTKVGNSYYILIPSVISDFVRDKKFIPVVYCEINGNKLKIVLEAEIREEISG